MNNQFAGRFRLRCDSEHSIMAVAEKVKAKMPDTVVVGSTPGHSSASNGLAERASRNAHTRKTYCVDCGTNIDSVPREILNSLEATRPASSNRNEELAHRMTRNTTIMKQQIDLATRMMLEQISRLSDGDYVQSMVIPLFLVSVDRATASSTASVSFQEQPMHFKDDQTLNLRVVDRIGDEGVSAIIVDGCNSCCHGESWLHNAAAKMKVLRLQPIWIHRRATIFLWRRNEHDKWKAENSHGHTTARV